MLDDDDDIVENNYYYDEGVYYKESSGEKKGYDVVQAPSGIEITTLPSGYTTTIAENMKYYYHGGAFYIQTDSSYKVVPAPIGAIIVHDGRDAYEVVNYKG